MLIRFAVTNYRGFSRRIEWDLSHPSNYSFNTFAIKDGVVKNGIIYGPNGAGKSNFGLALFDIVNHLSQRWKKPDYYENFVYAGCTEQPVHFEYTFKFGENIVYYSYSKKPDGKLTAEDLQVNGRAVFSRQGDVFSIDEGEYPMDETVMKGLAENANSISIVNYLLTSYPLPGSHYLIQLQRFVNSMLWFRCLEMREFIGLVPAPVNLDEFIIRQGLVDDFSAFIRKMSGQSFDFLPPADGDKVLLCSFNGARIAFDKIASTGTSSLMLLYYWLKQMSEASFVFIDEFDAFYHYRLSYEVCKSLFSLDCQAFTSSHNTYLMTNELLRPDCHFIIDNNRIKPLDECTDKELRFGHNIEKLFRGNAFSV